MMQVILQWSHVVTAVVALHQQLTPLKQQHFVLVVFAVISRIALPWGLVVHWQSSPHVVEVQTAHVEEVTGNIYICVCIKLTHHKTKLIVSNINMLRCIFTISTQMHNVQWSNIYRGAILVSEYLFPATAPSFLPIASSNSIPAHMPLAKSVLPMYFNRPVFAPPTNTLSPTYVQIALTNV